MALNDGPLVKIRGGAWVYLLEWQRRDDGWWAKTGSMTVAPHPRTYAETLTPVETWYPAGDVLQIGGQDYTEVRRTDARTRA